MMHVERYPNSRPEQHIVVEKRPRYKGFLAALGLVAVGGGLLGFIAGETNGFHFFSGIHAPSLGFGDKPSHGTDTPRPDQTFVTKDFVTCSDTITSVNGIDVSSQEFEFSGYTINHLWPIDYPTCTPSGYLISGHGTTAANGKTTIVASEPEFSSRWGRVDFNRGDILCENNPADASNAQIRASEKAYAKALKNHQTINCNFGEHTTGLRIVTDNVPGKDEMNAGQLAQDAAEIIPPIKKTEEKIIHDGYEEIKATLETNHPGATIVLFEAPVATPVEEIEANWDANGSNVKFGAVGEKFANVKGQTEFLLDSIYDGNSGADILPMHLTNPQVQELNDYIHQAHPNKITDTVPTAPPHLPQIERATA